MAFLNNAGLERLWEKIIAKLNTKVDKVSGKGLSTNDYTTTEKNKLAGIATGATKVTVDSALSSSSTNPVQNKVVNTEINSLKSLVGDTAVSTQVTNAKNGCITGLSVSGRTVTYTKGDGSTGTITTQDTNTTYSNMKGATSSAAGTAGLVPAPASGKQTSFLRGDGTWVVPTNTTYSNMTGATTNTAGTSGLVPAPTKGAATRYLRSDGTWQVPPDTNTTYSAATTSAAGLMSKDDKAKLDAITASADAVSFSRSLTSGTKIGTITINDIDTDLYAPTNTDTHYTTGLKVGASNTTTANAAASNGSVYLNVLDNTTVRDSHKIVGSGAITVTSDANGDITINSTNERKYVEEFITSSNTIDDAFADLITYCTDNGYVACSKAKSYILTQPLEIGDVDVDFSNTELINNESTVACVILTGANQKVHKFGVVTGKQCIAVLVNTSTSKYDYNKFYARMIRGYINALAIITTNYGCNYNEFHVLRLRTSGIGLKTYSDSGRARWANECYFYLGKIESYREIKPTKLIEMTNTSRCNIYNLDISQELLNPDTDPAIELINCIGIAFFNPRVLESLNAIQFKFTGGSFNNFIDCEYCRYATIDNSEMVRADARYNVVRGMVVTSNNGITTNCKGLRIYRDMIVPDMLLPLSREIRAPLEINHSLFATSFSQPGATALSAGIPTLYKWISGDITINRRFIALLPQTLQIIKTSNSVGNIIDEEGNTIIAGTNLTLNKYYDIKVNSITPMNSDPVGEDNQLYMYYGAITLVVEQASGQDGYTPVKGTDYWTDADKAEIISSVVAAIPSAEEVSF